MLGGKLLRYYKIWGDWMCEHVSLSANPISNAYATPQEISNEIRVSKKKKKGESVPHFVDASTPAQSDE